MSIEDRDELDDDALAVKREGGGRRSPERVWTLRVLPLESLPAALTVKGAGGEKQPGRTPTLVLRLSGGLLFRMAARAL